MKTEISFLYQMVKDKIVGSEPYQGTILDIGYYGVKAKLGHQVESYSEVRMEIYLSIVGCRATDIYGRILRTQASDGRVLASIEFTSISATSQALIQRFVQLLVQGCEGG